MAIDMAGIKNVIKYIQESEPTDQNVGDVWMRPSEYSASGWNGTGWINLTYRPNQGGWEYGYCMGGWTTVAVSTIDRITFPFNSGTATHVGNLPGTKISASGCNSSDYGFTFSGSAGSYTRIDRIEFPFDSGTATAVGLMSRAKGEMGACNSSNYGFCLSGWRSVLQEISTIDRITFPFNSGTASHVGNSQVPRGRNEGLNSSIYGYIMGGTYRGTNDDMDNTSKIDRLTFPFNSGTALSKGNLTTTKEWGATFNSSTYGYYAGGFNFRGQFAYTRVDRITFPFDSGTASNIGDMAGSRYRLAGVNSTDYGFAMGGTNRRSTIDRLTFPFNSGTASHVGNLSGTRGYTGGLDGTDFVALFN